MKKIIMTMAVVLLTAACAKKDNYDATGNFEAETVTLSSEAAAKVTSMNCEEGQQVEAGQVLMTLDSTQLVLQRRVLEQQRSALLAGRPDVEKQLASLKEQIKKQKTEKARVESLLKSDAATTKQLDDASAQLRVLQSQYEATLSQLGKTSASIDANAATIIAQIDQIDSKLEQCRIVAPSSGVVLTRYLDEGELAVVGKPLVKLGKMDEMYLRAYFTSEQLADIKVGQQVTAVADFGGDKQYRYQGKIVWISSESEFTPKNIQTRNSRSNLVYAAKIAVKNDGRIKMGQYGEVIL